MNNECSRCKDGEKLIDALTRTSQNNAQLKQQLSQLQLKYQLSQLEPVQHPCQSTDKLKEGATMDTPTLETLLKLMNKYGCTNLRLKDIELSVPAPKQDVSSALTSISDLESKKVKAAKKAIDSRQSNSSIDDELLFFHEDADLDI